MTGSTGLLAHLKTFWHTPQQKRAHHRVILSLCVILLTLSSVGAGALFTTGQVHASASLPPPTCGTNTCDGKGPFGTYCWYWNHNSFVVSQLATNSDNSANRLDHMTLQIYGIGGDYSGEWLGNLNLWYSSKCETNWLNFQSAHAPNPNPYGHPNMVWAVQNLTIKMAIAVDGGSILPSAHLDIQPRYNFQEVDGSMHTPMVYAPKYPVGGCIAFYDNANNKVGFGTIEQSGFQKMTDLLNYC